jgi:hypothetical protein
VKSFVQIRRYFGSLVTFGSSVGFIFALQGCGILKKKQEPDPITPMSVSEKPLTTTQAKEVLKESGANWLYGQGFGATLLNVGGIILFPPYALYLLMNAGISVSGYEPLYITNVLPEEPRETYHEAYDAVTSVPGRVAATVAGESYRTPEVAKERINAVMVERSIATPEAAAPRPQSSFPNELKPSKRRRL